jgi:hypothetical protein
MTAIFCRTGSAIQSAVAKWNLTSAFEFTVDERRREHRSLRLLRRYNTQGTSNCSETMGGHTPNQPYPL